MSAYTLWAGSKGETVAEVETKEEAAAWLAGMAAAPYCTELTCRKAWFGWTGPDGDGDRVVLDL